MDTTRTIAALLAEGEQVLRDAGIANCRPDAALLLRHTLGLDQSQLIARDRDEVSSTDFRRYLSAIARRAAREPLQYITGHQEFYGLDFLVTPDVLIPRPETEFLVEKVLFLASELSSTSPSIVDAGTGSGCVAIAVASKLRGARLIATDVSAAALAIAKENSLRHQVDSRIEFLEGDLLRPLDEMDIRESIDIIASNPPYVPDSALATLESEVRDYEPRLALAGGDDGLDLYRRLLVESREYLRSGGFLVFEIGFGQLDEIARLARGNGWNLVDVINDLQSIPRTLVLQRTVEQSPAAR